MHAGLVSLATIKSIPNVCTCPSSQFLLLNHPCSPTQDRSSLDADHLLNVGQHTSLSDLVPNDAGTADCPSVSMVVKV